MKKCPKPHSEWLAARNMDLGFCDYRWMEGMAKVGSFPFLRMRDHNENILFKRLLLRVRSKRSLAP